MQVRALQGDSIDALCWRHTGRSAGMTEAVLAANPGLARLGPVLPEGTLVTLPEVSASPAVRPLLQLWD